MVPQMKKNPCPSPCAADMVVRSMGLDGDDSRHFLFLRGQTGQTELICDGDEFP